MTDFTELKKEAARYVGAWRVRPYRADQRVI